MVRQLRRAALALSLLGAATFSANAGSLTGASASGSNNYDISAYGTLDWSTWANGSVPGRVMRAGAGGGTFIPAYTVLGGVAESRATDGRRSVVWSGGTPIASSSGSTNVVQVFGVGSGFQFVLPADAQTRTVRFNFDHKSSAAQFRATLSDGSAPDFVATSSFAQTANPQYTLTYSADGPGRTLTVTFVMTMANGNAAVRLVGAAAPTFSYVNHAPTISAPGSFGVTQNQSAGLQLTAADVDGDSLTWSATGLPPGLSINTVTGLISGTPTTSGTFSASVTAADGTGGSAKSDTKSITFTVAPDPSNTPPSAASGNFTTSFETPVTFTPTWTDPDSGDSWTLSISTQPPHGTATVSAGKITYTPNGGFVGSDSFTFVVTDSKGAFASGTASGTVNPVVPMQVSSVTATQGTLIGSVQLSWPSATSATSYDVLRGLTPSDPSPSVLGNVAVLNFTDATASAGVKYWYSIRSRNASATGTESPVSSGFADTPPSGASASISATLETPQLISPVFTDPDLGDIATIAIVAAPSNGVAVVSGSQITYTPNMGYVGPESFQFSVTDRAGATTVGTASGSVSALTPGQVSTVTATKGTLVGSVSIGWVASANARSYRVLRGISLSDPAPSPLTVTSSTSFLDGTASPGTQYFYSVQALTIGQEAAPSPAVLGFADTPPSSASATFAAMLETPTLVTPTFTDPDAGDSATLVIVSQPANGVVTLSGNKFSYTPNPDFVGGDTFQFSVTDRAGASTMGTATGTVSAPVPAPVSSVVATQGSLLGSVSLSWPSAVNARSYRILRGISASDPAPTNLGAVTSLSYSDLTAVPGVPYYYSVQALSIGQQASPSAPVLGYADTAPSAASANFAATLETATRINPTFTDGDAGDSATFAVVSQPSNGVASVVANVIWYTPNPNYVGPESFVFSVTDRAGASTTGVASGTVAAAAPAGVVGATATQGTIVGSVSVTWPAAANARSYRVLRGASISDPSPSDLGQTDSLSWNDTTASPGVPLYYSVQSLTIGQQAAPSLPVLGYADTPPSAVSATFATPTNTQTVFAPSFTDPDAGDIATIAITAPPAHGSVVVIGGSFRYTPYPDYAGLDSFTFTVTDRAGATASGTASGSVTISMPDPIANLSASQGTSLTSINLSWTDSENATTYHVFRSTIATDPSPELIATVSGTVFTNTGLTPAQTYFYFVQPFNLTLGGALSSGVQGSTDTPPSGASAAFLTVQDRNVSFAPTWTDPDPSETHVLSIVSQPSHGVASVSGSQLVYTPAPGYVGADAFVFSVTDKAGASTNATASGTVNPGVPAAPLDFVVSQGTVVGGVSMSWASTLGSSQYLVSRSQVRGASAPEVIATVETNVFVDTNVTPGATYYYRIQGVGASGTGQYSEEVSGYADTPPSSATADVATIYNTPVNFRPTVVDPDPAESHIFAIGVQPAGGAVVLSADKTRFTYTPRPGFSGTDSFPFTATDVAGASVAGLARIGVGCPSPTVGSLAISQPKIFAHGGFTVSSIYGNTGCPGSLIGRLEVLSGGTLVYSDEAANLPGAVSANLPFAVDGLDAGTYSLRVTVTDTTTNLSSQSTYMLAVPAYRMPTFSATAVVFADLDTATVGVGRSDDCVLTASRSAAIADHSLCYYDVTDVPPGLVFDSLQPLPTWNGRPNVAGAYSPTLTVYQYDDAGSPKALGQVVRSVTVQSVGSMTFSSPTNIDAAQFIQQVPINVTQSGGPHCPLTTDRSLARANTLRGVRSCFVEYSPLPPRSTLTPTGLSAYFLTAGTASVGWSISTFDTAGGEVQFASGSSEVNVRPVDVNFEPQWGDRNPIATVTRASVRLVNKGTDKCTGTTDPLAANVPNADKPCLIEWTSIPTGLSQDKGTDAALLTGVFTSVGQVPIGFTVSYFDVEGNKQLLLSATKNVSVDPPPLPPFAMKAARPIGGDRYVVPDSGGVLGILVTEPGKWPIDATVQWSDQSRATTYRINPTTGTQLLAATPSSLWSSRDVDVRLQLRDAPDLYTQKRITVISVPPDGIRLGLDPLNSDIPDSEPVPVTARVDMMSKMGPVYDKGYMGRWAVQFGLKDASSQFVPQGDPVPVDDTGVATSTLNPFGFALIRVQAVAVPITDVTGYNRKLESPLRMATVVKGTPINATIGLFRGAPEGPAPFIAVLRTTFKTRSDQLANESVKWHRSADGGATWEDVPEDGLQITQRLPEGRHHYKATFTNRNTHVVSESNVLELRAWAVPKISFTGNTYAFPGTPTNLSIVLTHPNGSAVSSGVLEWSVNKRVQAAPGAEAPPPVASGTGPSINFTGADPGTYMITVRARMAASNPDDPRAWGQAIASVVYGAPERPFAQIIGPNRAEVGKSYSFEPLVRTRYDISKTNLRLGGRWTLPNGTQVESLTPTSYAPTDGDLSIGKYVSVKYEVWVVGYEDTTTTSTTLSIPIWKYIWPSWSLNQSVVVPYAPTNSRITVIASDPALLGTLEGLTYSWTVPPTMRVVTVPTNKLDTTIDFGGTHPVSVTISDRRGNSTTLDTSVTVAPAAPYLVILPVSNMSAWAHAPLTIGLTPKVSGGHPLDAITSWSYYLDGVRLDLPNKSTAQIPIASPGSHTVEVKVGSKMGASATQSAVVNVPSNIPATCDIGALTSTGKTAIYLKANCIDPDGAITRYQWAVNGVPQTIVSGYKWTFLVPPGTNWPVRIDLTVTDDGGGMTSSGVNVN